MNELVELDYLFDSLKRKNEFLESKVNEFEKIQFAKKMEFEESIKIHKKNIIEIEKEISTKLDIITVDKTTELAHGIITTRKKPNSIELPKNISKIINFLEDKNHSEMIRIKKEIDKNKVKTFLSNNMEFIPEFDKEGIKFIEGKEEISYKLK